MTEHPNAAVWRELMDLMVAGETDKMGSFLADDIVYHQIGLPPIMGKAALIDSMKAYEGVDFEAEIHDVVANDDHTIGLVNATVRLGDQEFSYRTAEIMHIEDGKITERWAFSDDTEAINNFFGQFPES
jgi:uncharacterized protein